LVTFDCVIFDCELLQFVFEFMVGLFESLDLGLFLFPFKCFLLDFLLSVLIFEQLVLKFFHDFFKVVFLEFEFFLKLLLFLFKFRGCFDLFFEFILRLSELVFKFRGIVLVFLLKFIQSSFELLLFFFKSGFS
jgi:hypothetical protein